MTIRCELVAYTLADDAGGRWEVVFDIGRTEARVFDQRTLTGLPIGRIGLGQRGATITDAIAILLQIKGGDE